MFDGNEDDLFKHIFQIVANGWRVELICTITGWRRLA